ncbi:5-oxoprolinase subunit PxpA [Carboxylicivirga marina]|uniref:LamB/YcsF family protein n=1 Tax=Carboxylicivirga marina TaxID=2800988 RepID=A0ABS1HLV0_9BACT|nr:5-oxoprolinase subunit PxpA [Carboxylicivirga marina]MBK3518585.1 LamB/YcsF family protein [Carboxylicivirga marina]
MKYIDINCDLGEGIGNDAAVMPFISSANIACGYHAGDINSMDKTVQMARENKVAIGVHPGFNDPDNFGRIAHHLSAAEIEQLVKEQVVILQKQAVKHGCSITHVKPHGALYNMAAADYDIALAIAQGIKAVNAGLLFYGLANSLMLKAAEDLGLKAVSEVFADRAYTSSGQLVSRQQAGAVIHDVERCKKRVLDMVLHNRVESIDGEPIAIKADTICIHGDNPGAVELAKALHGMLKANHIQIVSPISQL